MEKLPYFQTYYRESTAFAKRLENARQVTPFPAYVNVISFDGVNNPQSVIEFVTPLNHLTCITGIEWKVTNGPIFYTNYSGASADTDYSFELIVGGQAVFTEPEKNVVGFSVSELPEWKEDRFFVDITAPNKTVKFQVSKKATGNLDPFNVYACIRGFFYVL